MQDNAPAHSSKFALKLFHEQGIRVLEWPARSPDLNSIENQWVILGRDFFANARQFTTTSELVDCISDCWNKVDENRLQRPLKSIHNRLDWAHS